MTQDTEHDLELEPDDKPHDKEFMATLAKGLALLGAFDKQRPSMTLSEAAKVTGFSRATARRILRTLTELGYVMQNGRAFSLSSGILRLGFAYLATQNWIEQASPLMRQLGEEFHESCSAAILEGTEIVYVARYPARRIMSVTLAVGTRLPAFHTSLGRVQLGFLDDAELWCRLRSLRIEAYTPSTITDMQALYERVLRQEPLDVKRAARTTAIHIANSLDQRTAIDDVSAVARLREGSGRKRYRLDASTRIGRRPDNDIVLDDDDVSRHRRPLHRHFPPRRRFTGSGPHRHPTRPRARARRGSPWPPRPRCSFW
jgi:DNA-binding IclR family transcriptional regulator